MRTRQQARTGARHVPLLLASNHTSSATGEEVDKW